jgi:hypothetical protein
MHNDMGNVDHYLFIYPPTHLLTYLPISYFLFLTTYLPSISYVLFIVSYNLFTSYFLFIMSYNLPTSYLPFYNFLITYIVILYNDMR